MRKGKVIALVKMIVLLGVVFAGYMLVVSFLDFNSVSVASWNLEIFGDKKAGDVELMNFYAERISDYDIVFIQEIRDKDGSAFTELCGLLQNYSCKISSRAGTTSSKEQYGVFYKDSIELVYLKDYNPLEKDKWERPPIEVAFNINDYHLTIYNIHVKPIATRKELANLDALVSDFGNVLIIGDLNADCAYYKNDEQTEFDDWNWIIRDDADTTSGATNCAYDRIILNDNAKKEFLNYGIYKRGINSSVSDHYLVWVKLRI